MEATDISPRPLEANQDAAADLVDGKPQASDQDPPAAADLVDSKPEENDRDPAASAETADRAPDDEDPQQVVASGSIDHDPEGDSEQHVTSMSTDFDRKDDAQEKAVNEDTTDSGMDETEERHTGGTSYNSDSEDKDDSERSLFDSGTCDTYSCATDDEEGFAKKESSPETEVNTKKSPLWPLQPACPSDDSDDDNVIDRRKLDETERHLLHRRYRTSLDLADCDYLYPCTRTNPCLLDKMIYEDFLMERSRQVKAAFGHQGGCSSNAVRDFGNGAIAASMQSSSNPIPTFDMGDDFFTTKHSF